MIMESKPYGDHLFEADRSPNETLEALLTGVTNYIVSLRLTRLDCSSFSTPEEDVTNTVEGY